MSNTFNYARFGKLFRKHTVENFKNYLMSAAVLCGCMVLFFSFIFSVDNSRILVETQMISFVIFYLVGGTVFTSTIFSDYGKPRESVGALTLPASHFEKFLIGWLYSFLIFTLVFLVVFYAIDIPFVKAGKVEEINRKTLELFDDKQLYYVFFIYAILNAFSMFGAVFFRKLHFVKTACVFFLLLVILTVFHQQLMKGIIPHEIYVQQPFGGFQLKDDSDFFMIRLDKDVTARYTTFLFTGLSLVLWAGAYFQLKEKQI